MSHLSNNPVVDIIVTFRSRFVVRPVDLYSAREPIDTVYECKYIGGKMIITKEYPSFQILYIQNERHRGKNFKQSL